MNRQEILDFVRSNPLSHMATMEDGQPRVRAMMTAHIDEAGLTFCTGVHKRVCRQLMASDSVELSYWSESHGLQLRVRGRMEPVDSLDLKQHIVSTTFRFLQPVVDQHGYESLALFRLSHGEARIWWRDRGGTETVSSF